MKFLKKRLKWVLGIIGALVITSYIFDYDYILKGVRVVYFTGHATAFIDDYPYFENDIIKKGKHTDEWPLHKDYNLTSPTKALTSINNDLGTVAYLIIKNDLIKTDFVSFTLTEGSAIALAQSHLPDKKPGMIVVAMEGKK